MSENHTNLRDEQFWFTAAVVGFNTLIIGADDEKLPGGFLILAAGMVSLLGAHLILTRWLKASGRSQLDDSFDNKKATSCQRGHYTLGEIHGYLRQLPYVITELSGSLFYLVLIAMTLTGVVIVALCHESGA